MVGIMNHSELDVKFKFGQTRRQRFDAFAIIRGDRVSKPSQETMAKVQAWRDRGEIIKLNGQDIFVVDEGRAEQPVPPDGRGDLLA